MIYGSGKLSVCATLDNFSLFSKIFIPPCFASFSFQIESQSSEATFLNSRGIVQVRDAGITQERHLLTISIQEVDFSALQLAIGELSIFTNGLTIDEIENVTLTSTSFTDSRVTSSTEADIVVYNLTSKQIMKKVTGSPSNNNEYQIVSFSNTINFNTSQLGQTVSIKLPNPNQTRGTIGGTSFAELFNYSFTGLFFTTSGDGPYTLQIDNLRRIGSPTLTANGDVNEIELQFIAVCGDNADNERKPFRLLSPTIGVSLNQFNYLLEDGFDLLLETGDLYLVEDSP